MSKSACSFTPEPPVPIAPPCDDTFVRGCTYEDVPNVYVRHGSTDPIVSMTTRRDYMGLIRLFNTSDIATVLDAGANAGFATLIFAARFPQARIVAVEAERSNFGMLQRNTRHLDNVWPLNAALSDRPGWQTMGPARLGNEYASQTFRSSYRAEGAGAGQRANSWRVRLASGEPQRSPLVRTLGVAHLMRHLCVPRIDFLKLDVEGSELHVLSNATDLAWLRSVRYAFVETHDKMPESEGSRAASLRALSGAGMRVSAVTVRGESLLLGCSGELPLAHCSSLCGRWMAYDAAVWGHVVPGRLRCRNLYRSQ